MVIGIVRIVLSCIVFTDDTVSTKIKKQTWFIINDVIDDLFKTRFLQNLINDKVCTDLQTSASFTFFNLRKFFSREELVVIVI